MQARQKHLNSGASKSGQEIARAGYVHNMFISSTINVFVFYLKGGSENPDKQHKLGEKILYKL